MEEHIEGDKHGEIELTELVELEHQELGDNGDKEKYTRANVKHGSFSTLARTNGSAIHGEHTLAFAMYTLFYFSISIEDIPFRAPPQLAHAHYDDG